MFIQPKSSIFYISKSYSILIINLLIDNFSTVDQNVGKLVVNKRKNIPVAKFLAKSCL